MTSLNSKLQLALINRKKGRNILEKGFTLVELMIVIVIVGVLSAVALPNFLNQTNKAKATECTSKIGAILSAYGAEAQGSASEAFATATATVGTENTNSEFCTLALPATAPTGSTLTLTAEGKAGSDIAGKYFGDACVNYATGKKDIVTSPTAIATADKANCA